MRDQVDISVPDRDEPRRSERRDDKLGGGGKGAGRLKSGLQVSACTSSARARRKAGVHERGGLAGHVESNMHVFLPSRAEAPGTCTCSPASSALSSPRHPCGMDRRAAAHRLTNSNGAPSFLTPLEGSGSALYHSCNLYGEGKP